MHLRYRQSASPYFPCETRGMRVHHNKDWAYISNTQHPPSQVSAHASQHTTSTQSKHDKYKSASICRAVVTSSPPFRNVDASFLFAKRSDTCHKTYRSPEFDAPIPVLARRSPGCRGCWREAGGRGQGRFPRCRWLSPRERPRLRVCPVRQECAFQCSNSSSSINKQIRFSNILLLLLRLPPCCVKRYLEVVKLAATSIATALSCRLSKY